MATQSNPAYDPERDRADSGAAGDAQAKAQQAAGQAQEKAQAAAGQAQAKVREQLDQRSSQLAEQAQQQASDLRSVSEALRDQGKHRPAEAVDRVAGFAERAGGYLRDTSADAMLSDAEDFGRQRPGAVAAGAIALGFVASRFLKASSSKRYSGRDRQQPVAPGPEPSPAGSAVPPVIEPLPVTPSNLPSARPGI
jgi:hypothetical protein